MRFTGTVQLAVHQAESDMFSYYPTGIVIGSDTRRLDEHQFARYRAVRLEQVPGSHEIVYSCTRMNIHFGDSNKFQCVFDTPVLFAFESGCVYTHHSRTPLVASTSNTRSS